MIVRKKISALQLVLSAFCMLSLFGLPVFGQDKGKDEAVEHPNGLVQDWSHRHAVYPRVGPVQNLIKVQDNPRAIQSWQAAARSDWRRWNNLRFHHAAQSGMRIDWSISLGGGTTAKSMYPAKFGFNPNALVAPANCSTDFIVFPINAVGSGTQPNIVGFNNLYRGPASGFCNAAAVAGVDDGVSGTTMWSYNVTAAGGKVATSPVLSLDGTKIAFVETKSGGAAHFHVLAWKSGDTLSGNLQNVLMPKTINSGFATTAPAAGSGTATDLALTDGVLGASSDDTLSSPFFEYGRDLAYVGNDTGVLFRIKNVFCLYAGCASLVPPPVPSLDTTWNATGALQTLCTGKLTSPVVDGGTGNVFVGCASDGKLYGYTETGTALTPLLVGNNTPTGGIVDAPLVDGVHGLVYAVAGNSGSGKAVVVQAKTADLTLLNTATLANGGAFNLHAPTFNDKYYSSITPTDWLLYEVVPNASVLPSGGITLYGIAFTGSHLMNGGTPTNADNFSTGTLEISPLTEFLTTGGEDRVFESVLGAITGNLASFNVTTTFPATLEHSATEGNGTTGIVIDNDASATNQANSLYFGVLGSNTAVKLTQGALQ